VIDEDGCYDPADFNDGLLLGLKGTMAQAELHFLRTRLQGGKLNKAKKGELRFPLPVGFRYDEQGRIILDPDEEVRGAVALVFRLFRETGSAFAVVTVPLENLELSERMGIILSILILLRCSFFLRHSLALCLPCSVLGRCLS
jgi:hypothetical protein